jgi:hypothetical protein
MIGLILPSFEQYRYVRELRKQKRRDDEQQSRRQCQLTKKPALTTHTAHLDDDSADVTECVPLSFSPYRANTTSRTSAKVNKAPGTSQNDDCGISLPTQLSIARPTTTDRPSETTTRQSYNWNESNRNNGNDTNLNNDTDDETVIPQQGPIVVQSSSSSSLSQPSADTKRMPPLSPLLQSKDGQDDLPRNATPLGPPTKEVSNFNIPQATQAKLNFSSNVKLPSAMDAALYECSIDGTNTSRQQVDTESCPQELLPIAKNNSSNWIPTYTASTLARRRMLEQANKRNTTETTIHISLPEGAPTTTPVKQNRALTTSTAPSSGSCTAPTTTITTTTTPVLQHVLNTTLSNQEDSNTATTTGASSSMWDSPDIERMRPPKRPWFQRSATYIQGGRARRRKLQQQNLQLIFKKAP